MKRLLLTMIVCGFLLPQVTWGQSLLLEENFAYTVGSYLSTNSWTAYNAGSIEATINSANLTFTSYPSISANSLLIGDDGIDYYKSFNQVSSGSVYCSFLVNVISATESSSIYFFTLGGSTSSYVGRIYVSRNGSNLAFGISKGSSAATYTDYSYQLNTIYLIILKYVINTGTKNDDVAMFIFDSTIPITEPAPTITHITETTNDPSSISLVFIRQDATTNDILIDGIRVSTSWEQAPLPVQLTSFTAIVNGNLVHLNWSTSTELNNYGYNIERRTESEKWVKIGFVPGHGNSNSVKNYKFIDDSSPAGKLFYRLKQVDFDGKYEYSNEVEVQVDRPLKLVLFQNRPNPFNPKTEIKFELPNKSNVELDIYNMLGEKILNLARGFMNAGEHEVSFNACSLSSGVYLYKLTTENNTLVKKMVFLK